jgi:hypothetical protein
MLARSSATTDVSFLSNVSHIGISFSRRQKNW